MSITVLQEAIRRRHTPVALTVGPDPARLAAKDRERFAELYGAGSVAQAEALRFHGVRMLDAAAGRVAAVVLRAEAYLRRGAVGFDVLANLVSAARARELYTVVDCRSASAEPWLSALPEADAVTVLPYLGADACAAPEGKAVFAAVQTANPSAGELQDLRSGDRKLSLAAAEQMARHGAGILLESGYSLDIRDMRRRLGKAFFLLTGAAPEDAVYAFDDYGHGALVTDGEAQYAPDPAAALDSAVAVWKKWVTVV